MQKVALVAGGSGFVGRYVVRLLEKSGYRVIVHSRSNKGVPTHADIIINLVGIIREDNQTYKEAHVEFTKWLVGLGKKLQVKQFVQLSALGVEAQETEYQRTKVQGEEILKKSGLPFAIIRPSMIFGPEDRSINRFRAVARTGFFPLFGNGIVQPVSVETVAKVIVAAAEGRVKNRTAELAGPEAFTYAQLLDRIHPGVKTFNMPRFITPVFTFLGDWFGFFPTNEQVTLLQKRYMTKDKTVDRLKIKNPKLK